MLQKDMERDGKERQNVCSLADVCRLKAVNYRHDAQVWSTAPRGEPANIDYSTMRQPKILKNKKKFYFKINTFFFLEKINKDFFFHLAILVDWRLFAGSIYIEYYLSLASVFLSSITVSI